MVTSRQELFVQSYIRRVAERQAKRYISAFCQGMPVQDFRYAAEHDLDVVSNLLRRFLLRPGEEKAARKKVAPYRKLVERLADPDTVTRLFSEVSPEHGKVLQEHRSWLERQIRSGLAALFAT